MTSLEQKVQKKVSQKSTRLNIINFFLELETTVQLYHWMTTKFSRHKGSDFLYENAIEKADKFMEVYLGKYGRNNKDFSENMVVKKLSDTEIVTYLQRTAKVLEVDFPKNLLETDTDLLNIRDELLACINQTLYLFTLE